MACNHVEAEVLVFRTQVISDNSRANTKGASLPPPLDSQDAPVNLDSLRALCTAVDTSSGPDAPPQKRRKTETDSDDVLQSARDLKDRSVVLSKVSINLVRHRLTGSNHSNKPLELRSDCNYGTVSCISTDTRKIHCSLPRAVLRSECQPIQDRAVRSCHQHKRRDPRHRRFSLSSICKAESQGRRISSTYTSWSQVSLEATSCIL